MTRRWAGRDEDGEPLVAVRLDDAMASVHAVDWWIKAVHAGPTPDADSYLLAMRDRLVSASAYTRGEPTPPGGWR